MSLSRLILGLGLAVLTDVFVRWRRERIYIVGEVLIGTDGECEEARMVSWHNSESDAKRAVDIRLMGVGKPLPGRKADCPRFTHVVMEVHDHGDLTDPIESRWYSKVEGTRVRQPAAISDFWSLGRG